MGTGNNPATLQVANPTMGTVSRKPQTTAQPGAAGSVPFSRISRQGQIQGPAISGQTYGSLWTPILKPVGGYLRFIDLTISGTAWATAGTLPTGTTDAPYNVIQNIFLRDPFGQPIFQGDGFSAYLINCYSGQCGMLGFGNQPNTNPSWVPLTTTGVFSFSIDIPLELDSSGFCSLPTMNAASQPQLQIQMNPIATVFTGSTGGAAPTGTAGTLTMQASEPYWMAPVDQPQIAPPDVGSSAQWSVARAATGIATGQFQRVVLPRVGTFIHTLILVLRDANGVRIDAWPTSDLSLWMDGVPVLYESFAERQDRMWQAHGVPRPTGVIVYSFRQSVQSAVSSADTYDLLAPTTPATLLEVAGTFGTIAAAPAQIQAITGELFPVGGIPYTHLTA